MMKSFCLRRGPVLYLKKSLGQHILTDGRILSRIARAAGVSDGDVCLEIGPGTGRLTGRLLERGARVFAVERDDRFAEALRIKATQDYENRLTVIHNDVLAVDLEAALAGSAPGRVKVVSNLPYNIAVAVVIRLLEMGRLFASLHVLVQDEVAQRMAAPPGDTQRGSLSVFCRARAGCRLLFEVPPHAFQPPPRVNSRLIEMIPLPSGPPVTQPNLLDKLVIGAFEHRRKTCYNSLRLSLNKGACAGLFPALEIDAFLDAAFGAAGLAPGLRAQDVPDAVWYALADAAALYPRGGQG